MSSPKLITKGMAWILDEAKSPPEVYIAGLQAGYGESPVKKFSLDLCTCALSNLCKDWRHGAPPSFDHACLGARIARAFGVRGSTFFYYSKDRKVRAKYDRTEKQVYSAIKAIHV